jgi:hypothetical protein
VGRNGLSDNRGSPERLRSVGIEGPKMSVSRIPLRRPRRVNARAKFTADGQSGRLDGENLSEPAIVDLPTPPLAEDTAITFVTFLICRLSGSPLCIRGMVPVLGNPYLSC